MSVLAPYVSDTEVGLDIDNKAALYGLYRFTDESLENFKNRILSTFIYESSNSESGYSYAAARALGAYPKVIGYLRLNEYSTKIMHDGINVTSQDMEYDIEDEIFSVTTKKSLNLLEDLTLEKVKSELEQDNSASIILFDNKYLTKDMRFIMPFKTEVTTSFDNVRPGSNFLYKTLGIYIDPTTFRNRSLFLKRKLIDPSLLIEIGDYYFNSETGQLILFDDGSISSDVEILYRKVWKYIPIVYCPVSVITLDKLKYVGNTNFGLENASEVVNNIFSAEDLNPEILNYFWDAFISNNSVWKANQTSAVAVNGTYYAN